MMSDQSYYKYPQDQIRGQSGREFIDRFANTAAGLPTYTRTATTHGPQMFSSYDTRKFLQPTEMAGQIAGQYYGSKIHHPVMLPQPNRHASANNRAYSQKGTNTKRKDDAPKGGVASVLDYDLDVMTNFVAEMTQKL